MPNTKVQVKFTIDSDVVANFKEHCKSLDLSMTSVVCQYMRIPLPMKTAGIEIDNRRNRKKAVKIIIGFVDSILKSEATYRDAIPEQFEQRYEAADNSCELLEEAISCLKDAF
ncbi:MAG: hypothetical protein LBB91_02435 [Clostridiales bacterium]|jgi:hypothetical protein|nr:hypothetical protein [Clostridiales bacterium]